MGGFVLLAGILGLIKLPHPAYGTSNNSISVFSSTIPSNSTSVLMTSSMTSLTSSSLISSDVPTMLTDYVSPTPSLTQYKSVVQNTFSLSSASFSRLIVEPSTSLTRLNINSSTSLTQQNITSTTRPRETSSTAISLSADKTVSVSSKSSLTSKDSSLYSSFSSQFFHSSVTTKQHAPASSSFFAIVTPKLTPSASIFGTSSNTFPGTNGVQQTGGVKHTPSIIPSSTSSSNKVSRMPSIYIAKPSMVIKPPPLVPVTTPTMTSSSHGGCRLGNCCTHALSQLPVRLDFEESENRGYIMAVIRDVKRVNFTVKVLRPLELVAILKDNFNITTTNNGYNLVLSREIDLEELYDQTDGKVDVHRLQLQISCTENSSVIVPPRMLNVTIDDVDDNMPVFRQSGVDSKDCVVPIYKADTSEDYTGELALSPGKIEAVDGDVSFKHNITYRVMHSEPEDYHVYFNLDAENGTVRKTKTMNSSDPNKYVMFVQAVEDSPQQKSRVAVLLVVVFAPSDPFSDPNKANPTAKLALQIACAFILMAFICGVIVIVHHRYTLSRAKVGSHHRTEHRDMKLPKLAVYQSSNSSLNSTIPEIPVINSPSQIIVASCENTLSPGKWDFENTKVERRESESQKKRRLIVKIPIDTKSRPSWNAPSPKPKRTRYNPFSVYKTQHSK